MEKGTLQVMTEELFEELNQLMIDAFKKAGISFDDIADMDDETVILMKRYFSMMKKCEDLASTQAQELDRIHVIEMKLDKLIAKKA
jgi:hypothetical protein